MPDVSACRVVEISNGVLQFLQNVRKEWCVDSVSNSILNRDRSGDVTGNDIASVSSRTALEMAAACERALSCWNSTLEFMFRKGWATGCRT